MDYRLLHNRAKLVKKYRSDPRPWPDGIGDWYGDGSAWPIEKVELWSSPGWLEDMLRGVTRSVTIVTPVTQDVTPSVTLVEMSSADVRRAKVRARVEKYRARKAAEAAKGE